MTDGHALLFEYAENGSEPAFRELVSRYIDLVYSTALRKVGGDAHLAQDVTQTVFLQLARKARTMPRGVLLGGWLHGATCNVAAMLTRTERRRQVREKEAVEMHVLHNDSAGTLDQVAPILDDAISQLHEEDQAAILLRFFERRDFRSVGEALGSSEDAARMRVNRALQKLELILKQRGVTASAAGLGVALTAEAVGAAPSGLAASVAGSALANAAATGAVSLSLFKIMAMTKLQLSVLGAVVVVGLATSLVVQQQALIRLAEDNRSLQKQVQEFRSAQARLAQVRENLEELEKFRRDQSELLRLRAEVTALRKAAKATALRSPPTDRVNPGAGAPADPALGVTRLQASIRAQVDNGETLFTGGWFGEPGKRIFVLATPRIWTPTTPSAEGGNPDQVSIKTKVIEVPEAELFKLGLDTFTTEGTESSLKKVFAPEQVDAMLKELEGTEGAKLLAESTMLTADGRQAQVQTMAQQDEAQQNLGPTIDIVPVVSNDKRAIDMTLQAGINRHTPTPQ